MNSLDLFSLKNRRALVTGSSKGIGNALARGLAGAGASVILNGRNSASVAEAATQLCQNGADVAELVFDVTDAEAARAAVDGFEAEHGAIDILINNAGMQHRTPLEEFDPADFDLLMKTNLNSAFYVGQAAARHMIGRGQGKIINIASIQTALARPGIAPYTASKGAVANLTKGMATDWGPKGLCCNAIAPGYFDTELNSALVADETFTAWVSQHTPLGRWGQLDELIGAAVFLSSDASAFVNGHTLFVDGGMSVCL